MPRAPVAGREIRRRSRNGCWNCKARKVKCGEEKPRCSNCERLDEDCDYKIRLSWGGRPLKKKQLENGGNGQDLNADDQSQFIPGAGQFSLNQHFPVAQAFVQATNTNGTARKPPVPRAGSGKKTTMSNYQTVFSVAEPPAPVVLPPAPINTSVAAPVDPQLTTPVAPPPPQSPTVTRQQQQRMSAFGWQQGLTPTTATTTSHFENEVMYRGDQQQSFYTPYTPVSAPFSPPNHSPNNSFSGINSHSPPGSQSVVTSPHTPYAQTHHSSPQRHQHKSFHPPPPILTSPNKRSRTSTSPIQPPPNSPFIFGVHTGYPASSLTTHATVLGTALDYIENPISGVSINQIANFHPGNSMRRVSVENLLSTPLRDGDSYPGGSFSDRFPEMEDLKREESPYPMNFGIDNGTPDMDRDDDEDVEDIPRHDGDFNVEGRVGYGSHLQNYQGRGFYRLNSPPRYPVQISIPRRLDPLPEMLLDNKKNMMYFHHYLHYTARLLVPHDCSENPFKSILPQMAVEKDHLMNLLLAYSASHRARLLEHAEPAERISRFLDETVSKLQISLNHPDEAKSDTTLATAIMLSSYQIISPNTPYDMIGITWQTHLNAARRIILSRGGAKGMHSSNKVSYFLVRWFAYLDLLGSLSGREIDEPLFSGKYWTNDDEDAAEEFTVDCFFGFTNRCVSILAKIGELARKCDIERRLQSDNAARGMIMTTTRGMQEQPSDQWTTPSEIVQEARILEQELAQAKDKALGNCSHHHHDNGYPHFRTGVTPDEFDAVELLATNDAFHWAALVHLYRRVLSYPSRHPKVQNAVGQIVGAMHKVRHGGTAENCLLFPLFSAGCEATEHRHREYTLRRMMEVEKSGLTQVRSARELMQRVWEVQRPWWEMADGEFIG